MTQDTFTYKVYWPSHLNTPPFNELLGCANLSLVLEATSGPNRKAGFSSPALPRDTCLPGRLPAALSLHPQCHSAWDRFPGAPMHNSSGSAPPPSLPSTLLPASGYSTSKSFHRKSLNFRRHTGPVQADTPPPLVLRPCSRPRSSNRPPSSRASRGGAVFTPACLGPDVSGSPGLRLWTSHPPRLPHLMSVSRASGAVLASVGPGGTMETILCEQQEVPG